VSGLKVNFHKIMLVWVNITYSCLSEVASILSCKVGKVLLMYLGLPIGGNPHCFGMIVGLVVFLFLCILGVYLT